MNYTFDMFCTDIGNIVNQVHIAKYEPFLIVGITRGGLIPAAVLAHRLQIPTERVETINWSSRFVPERIYAVHSYDLPILIVDDIVDTGYTQQEILEVLPRAKYASLIYNVGQMIEEPHFYGRIIDKTKDPSWIDFWWEKDGL
jgi:hypoxanthine phosphoribosyltransferase